jgi:Tfp pilus assembly protein PilX
MLRVNRDQDGWVLVVAMVSMALMLVLGLVILSTADTQTKQSRQQRERESAFNMAEAALGNEVFLLSRGWPGSSPGLAACTQSSAPTGTSTTCPVDATLKANFAQSGVTQADYTTGVTWKTQVLDDGSVTCTNPAATLDLSNYYVDAASNPAGAAQSCAASAYDANGNNQIWVRAEGLVRGHRRVLVGRAQIQEIPVPWPRLAVQAGHMVMSNNKNEDVNAGGTAISLRCGTAGQAMPPGGVPGCADFTTGQLTNGTVAFGYTPTNALPLNIREALKATAKAQGHYCGDATAAGYATSGFCDASGCPSGLGNSAGTNPGWIVWLDGVSATCKYTGMETWNSAAHPGMVIVDHGAPSAIPQLYLGGTGNFYGILYAINSNNLTADLIQLKGNGTIQGAVAVDGAGGVDFGNSNNTRLTFDPNITGKLSFNGAAGIVQNTWRQLQ